MVSVQEKENIIEIEEKEIIIEANNELNKLNHKDKEFIDSVLAHKINNCDISNPDIEFPTQIGTTISTFLSENTTTFLLNLISNPNNIKTTLYNLKEEKLISNQTADFVLKLTVKYGTDFTTVLRKIERPHNWLSISSETLIGDVPRLQSNICRIDGTCFNFDLLLTDSVVITEHIIRKTLTAIDQIGDDVILNFDEDKINELEKRVRELKELYESIKPKIDSQEQTEETTIE